MTTIKGHEVPMPRGYTFVEMLVTLALCSLVLAGTIPSFARMLARNEAAVGVNRIVGILHFTRSTAATFNTLTTVCPLTVEGACAGAWSGPLTVFTDSNGDARVGSRDRIIRRFPAQRNGTLTWRSFRRKPYLQMTPSGFTNYQNGNFVYCPADLDPVNARQIVINVSGRPRIVNTRDESGRVIDRKGRLLKCEPG